MAKFIYIAEPTSGKNSKDIKVPLNDGRFQTIKEVIPNETVIETQDIKSIIFLENNRSFKKIEE
jgi:hypothetical protein